MQSFSHYALTKCHQTTKSVKFVIFAYLENGGDFIQVIFSKNLSHIAPHLFSIAPTSAPFCQVVSSKVAEVKKKNQAFLGFTNVTFNLIFYWILIKTKFF